jgi:HlyD family secretion protein
MQVDTNISESDVGGIAEGQRSTFTVDAYPKRTFEGTVTQVRQSPQTIQNVVTYDIVITVDNRDLALRPGLTAATRIITDRRDNALRVPNAAFRYRPSRAAGPVEPEGNRIWVLREGSPTAVAVTAGLEDDSLTEIVNGELKEGDQVIVSEQNVTKPVTTPTLRF